MSRLVLYMSMSLDGFIAGPGDNKDNPFGTHGHRLHKWLGDGGDDASGFRPSDVPSQTVFDELMSTGAVITGRRTGDFVDYWGGDHHDGVPIFVPTHHAPTGAPPGDVRFVTDGIESCVEQAKTAAEDRDVMLHGAYTARECLRARVLDVLEIQLVPVLFGQGVHGAGAAQALLRAGLLDEMEIHLVPVLLGGGDICSTRLAPTTSNSNWSGDWRRAT